MNTTPANLDETRPLEADFDRFVAGQMQLPEFVAALRATRIFVLTAADPKLGDGSTAPMLLHDAAGGKLVAAFTSTNRAWDWPDPRFSFVVLLSAANVIRSVAPGLGLVINPASGDTVEISPEGVRQLQSGAAIDSACIRVRSQFAPGRPGKTA